MGHKAMFLRVLVGVALVFAWFWAVTPSVQAASMTESLNDGNAMDSDAQTILDMASPDQREALKDYLMQIAEIDLETQIAVEEYNSAHTRLQTIHEDIAQKELDLDVLNRAYAIQSRYLAERAVMYYKGGDLAIIEMLLDATSIENFIARWNYLSMININDLAHRERIAQEQAALQQSLAQLLVDRDEAASLDFELKARKIEIEKRNEQRTEALVEEHAELAALVRAYYIIEDLREARYITSINGSDTGGDTIDESSVAETALAYRGVPYTWGGASKEGFDGPGLLVFVFAQHGIELEHSATAQAAQGRSVTTTAALKPGDALFFGEPVRHAGIYLGNGYFIHAPNAGDVVRVSLLSERTDFAAARRYDWKPRLVRPL